MDLYRFFDDAGQLLYVGISLSAASRASQHRADKPWWNDVAHMAIEHLECDRIEAEQIERRIIIAEKPVHNIIHNTNRPTPSEHLMWVCTICSKPIDDRKGYIELPSAENRRYKTEHAAWKERHPEQENPGRFEPINLAALLDMPEAAQWWAVHRACDPNPDSGGYWFGVERCRTLGQLVEWICHLSEKGWIDETNWFEFIRRFAEPI